MNKFDEALEAHKKITCGDTAIEWFEKYASTKNSTVATALTQAAEIEREALQSIQWRPISEETKDGGTYLIACIREGEILACTDSFWVEDGEYWDFWEPTQGNDTGYFSPTHFMHLPPAPQGDE